MGRSGWQVKRDNQRARLDALWAEFKTRPLYKIKLLQTATFGPQRAFVLDPAKDKAALTTRRAGKSQSAATMLFIRALEVPNSIALYVALTRQSAKTIMWPILTELNRRFDLQATMQESALNIVLPNGSRIMLAGADMANFIERLRGAKYSIAIIDEAGSFRSHLKSLIDDVLTPALLDYNGPLVLLGTPGILPQGIFYDATTKPDSGYSVHRWSLHDNPHLPNSREYVANQMKKHQWTEKNPTYLREYCGEWVIDEDALVYKLNRSKNLYTTRDEDNTWIRVMSLDFGWNDQTAFTIASYSHTERKIYIEYSYGASELIPSQIASKAKQLQELYKPVSIVCDTGGLGKSIAEEFVRRYQLPVIAAEKKDKLTWINLMNGDLVDGNLFIHESLTPLQDQMLTLVKGDDGMEDPTLPNDLCDGVLYAWRQCKGYLATTPVKTPKETDKDYGLYMHNKLLQQEIEELEKQQDWWIEP